jgi:phosphatidylserine/phosphatidylglycerophosphate/cardiolipin synthase-like enzyme
MDSLSNTLLAQVRHIACNLPQEKLQSIIEIMEQHDSSLVSLQNHLTQLLPKSSWRQMLTDLLEICVAAQKSPSLPTIAAMLSTAAYCQRQFQQELSLEFVWTGPLPEGSLFRRTDQALLQMIREAQQSLTIVSFAVYKIPEIVEALHQATARGVRLTFVFEMPEVSDGKIAYGALASLDKTLLEHAKLLVWAKDKRPTNLEGKTGSLHAKFAISDNWNLLVSSANLTNYAMTLNMEMGVLIHSENFVSDAVLHLDKLMANRTLVLFNDLNRS